MSEPEDDGGKGSRRFWQQAGRLISLGWSLVLPIAGGALLGNYLDEVTEQGFVWTVGLLFGGVALSLYILYQEMTQ